MNLLTSARKKIVWSLAGVMLLSLAIVAQPAFAVTKLRMQSVFPNSSMLNGFMVDNFINVVKEKTNGEIDITLYPAGALTKPLETFDSVSLGVIDMALGTGAYHARKMPEALVEFGMPSGFSGPRFKPDAGLQELEFLNEWRDGIAGKKLSAVYKKHKVHLVGTGASTGYGFMTNFPMEKLEDIKGKKIRAFGLFNHVVKKIGGAPISLANSEQYLALQRGTIDGSIYLYYTLETYKLKEVVTHIVFPAAMPVVSYNCYANDKVWNKIKPEHQAIIDEVFAQAVKSYLTAALALEKRVVEAAVKGGVKEVFLSEADIKTMKDAGRSLWTGYGKKSETTAELVKLLQEYLAEKEK